MDRFKWAFFLGLIAAFSSSTFILLNAHGLEHRGRLKPFSSDGCSRFPDGPPGNPEKWRACCLRHDQAYWLGGTFDERVAADRALERCISEVENPILAQTMWAGVRVGGSPLWPTEFRWGYGWPYTRGYRPVTSEEYQLASSLLTGQPQKNPDND